MAGFFFYIVETPINHKTTQTNAGLFGYFSDIAEMRGLSIIASVKGNRTSRTKKKGETKMYDYYCSKQEKAEYRKGEHIDTACKIDGMAVLRKWEITSKWHGCNQKSFYGKAHCLIIEKGWYLLSYDTIVCSLHANDETGEINVLRRYWMEYSATTAKHINAFLYNFNLRGLNKKEWESLEYNTPYIIDNVS